MTDMLSDVMTSGTGTTAAIGRPAAGKTGTTDDNKDAWFVGYTPNIVTAVWIGDDTGSETLGEVYGGTIPAQIWHDYMSAAVADESVKDFDVPAGMAPIREEPEEDNTATEKSKTDKKADKKNVKTDKGKTDSEQSDTTKDRTRNTDDESDQSKESPSRNNKRE